ncbi:MAG TPA: hypothetical protein PLS51_13520, partial [Flavobacterium sp.]|nr:hypothetical protein [Flavobacterium sp.]
LCNLCSPFLFKFRESLRLLRVSSRNRSMNSRHSFMKTYNRYNFHKHTFCIFKEVPLRETENREPDFKSKSGSAYYFTQTGVYRLSNHWSRVANCRWRLEGNPQNLARTKLGFALWSAFHQDNETDKLYFITVDFANHSVDYEHKENALNGNAILRTAADTAKIVKQIRSLLQTDSWAKYKEGKIEDLRKAIVERLITTNLPLAEIKRNL